MKPVFIVEALRTPIGKNGGVLSTVRPDDLLALVIKAVMQKNPGIDPNAIEEVIAGAANQAGEDNRNVARMSALLAGLPVTVSGTTINKLCASGLQAIIDGSRQIACGDAELVIACGVESMSRAPLVMPKPEHSLADKSEVFDTTMGWRFVNEKLAAMYHPYSMGETAENIASQWKITRQEQDAFALESQKKYATARANGIWKDEIISVELVNKTIVDTDEHPRDSSLEKLATLKTVFKENGTVTAGNSSGINDGAAAVLLASEEVVKKYSLKPIAKIVASASVGVDPSIMGIGPVPATKKVLEKAGLSLDQIDLIELNEAFAAQSLACIRELQLDPAKVNVNGGAIAIGHPLGCSGVRISTTLLHEMKRRKAKYGLATMCVGVGQGVAIIYERLY